MPPIIEVSKEWRRHRGPYTVTINGIAATDATLCYPDTKKYVVDALPLCQTQREFAQLEVVPKSEIVAWKLARQCQIIASWHHFARKGCETCLSLLRSTLTPHERQFAYSEDPKLGRAIGIVEEKTTAADLLAAAGKDPRDANRFMDTRRAVHQKARERMNRLEG